MRFIELSPTSLEGLVNKMILLHGPNGSEEFIGSMYHACFGALFTPA